MMRTEPNTKIPTPVFLDARDLDLSRALVARASNTIVGQALEYQNKTASQILSTLGITAAYALGYIAVFLVLRRFLPKVYSPRTLVGNLRSQERSDPLPTAKLPQGLFNWIGTFYKVPDIDVLNKQSLDGYMFLRLLRVAIISCVVGCFITWPILIPINATGPGGQSQLNILTFSNAATPTDKHSYARYYAHVSCAYLYFSFIIWMITRESIYYINLRQAYLVSPLFANRISSRTVLYHAVPDEYCNEAVVRRLLGDSIVRHVWIPRHVSKLKDKVEERNKVAMKLENAEIKLIKGVNEARREAIRKDCSDEEMITLKKNARRQDSQSEVLTTQRTYSEPSDSVAAQWLNPRKRPTHRLKHFLGRKVDTIDWARTELSRLNAEVEALQQKHRAGQGKPYNSVFVEFKTLRDAQSAFQSLTHHEASRMSPRYIGISPEEVIWTNMRLRWWERYIRFTVATAAIVAGIIFWTVPITVISSITNAEYLASTPWLSWLGFINHLGAVTGIVTGLLPSILLSLVMTILPPVLRLIARFAGASTESDVEYQVQNSYFWFQVVQVFLVTTLAGGVIKTATQVIHNPGSIITVLASSLPQSSNFYLSYITAQGLGVVANTLVSPISLTLYLLLSIVLDHSPRSKYKRWTNLSNPNLGSVYPVQTNLFVIAIAYACIAPLVLGFAAIGLFFFYLAYRYKFLYVYNVPSDTKGLMYARALQQLFVGLYLAELCMIGLFSISIKETPLVLGPFVLMIVFLVLTVLYHIALNQALHPLLRYLPKTLETEEQRLLALEHSGDDDLEYRGADLVWNGTASASFDNVVEKGGLRLLAEQRLKAKVPSWFRKWLRPDVYADYYTLRKLVPRDFAKIEYDEGLEADSYFHPAVTSLPPTLWVPRDELGVSRQECIETSKINPMSDDGGAVLNQKGKIVWDESKADSVPIATKRIYY